MERHQLDYSLVQLRLVGILLLLVLVTRFCGVFFSLPGSPIQVLSAITFLSNWLPLLPLGISLYLLGGGRQRQPREYRLTQLLHNALVPLAMACLLVLPASTVLQVQQLSGDLRQAERLEQQLIQEQKELRQKANRAATPREVQALARDYGIELPVASGEPLGLTNWRLDRSLELQLAKVRSDSPTLSLSPYQRELVSPFRNISTLLMQVITGLGLLLLYRQGSREIRRHGLSISLFFRVDPDNMRGVG